MNVDPNIGQKRPGPVGLASLWVWLAIVMAAMFVFRAWHTELDAVAAMTPPWFTPWGAMVAAAGLVVASLVTMRGPHAAVRLGGLALLLFAPAVLYSLFPVDVAMLSGNMRVVHGALFALGPWVAALGAWLDDGRRGGRRGNRRARRQA
jgi:hypothetical protein